MSPVNVFPHSEHATLSDEPVVGTADSSAVVDDSKATNPPPAPGLVAVAPVAGLATVTGVTVAETAGAIVGDNTGCGCGC
jgi:hypothetical protein